MKIGLLIYGSLETVSGGYYYDRRLVASLQERGHAVRVVSIPWRNYAAHLSDNLSVRLPAGLDLLIQDELNHPSLIAANRRPHPYPVVSLVHHLRSSEAHPGWLQGVYHWVYRWIESHYLRSVDGFIFNSKITQQAVCALVGDAKPAIVAYPPVDRFHATLSKDDIAGRAVQPGPLRILFLGNVIPRKGLHTLLAAIASLPAHSILLDVAGSLRADPVYAEEVRNQAASIGARAAITFHGILEDGSLQKKMEEAHILVVPSSYEGFGIAYLEGMGFGLPAIGTTAGGATEIIRPGENGYLIPPGDAVALSARLQTLQASRELLAQLSMQALEEYRQWQPWSRSVESIQEFLMRMRV